MWVQGKYPGTAVEVVSPLSHGMSHFPSSKLKQFSVQSIYLDRYR